MASFHQILSNTNMSLILGYEASNSCMSKERSLCVVDFRIAKPKSIGKVLGFHRSFQAQNSSVLYGSFEYSDFQGSKKTDIIIAKYT